MINDLNELSVTREQLGQVLRSLEDPKANVLPQDPKLFAVMAEAPFQDLAKLRQEIDSFVPESINPNSASDAPLEKRDRVI